MQCVYYKSSLFEGHGWGQELLSLAGWDVETRANGPASAHIHE